MPMLLTQEISIIRFMEDAREHSNHLHVANLLKMVEQSRDQPVPTKRMIAPLNATLRCAARKLAWIANVIAHVHGAIFPLHRTESTTPEKVKFGRKNRVLLVKQDQFDKPPYLCQLMVPRFKGH